MRRIRRPHYTRSLASRVILLTTMAVGATLTLVSLAIYLTVRAQTMSTLDDSLRDRALQATRANTLDSLAQEQIPSWALGAADVKFIFINLGNVPIARTADNTESLTIGAPELRVAAGHAGSSVRTVGPDEQHYRMVAVPAGRGRALVLAQSMTPTERLLERLGLVLLLFGVAGVVLAGLSGYAVAEGGLRPVRRLTAAVEDLTRTQQLDPIPVTGTDEVARLSTSFNGLLAAVSASQERQRQLVADAGHELRTPLTSLRTNLDLLAQAGAHLTEEQRQELLDDVRAQIQELTTLIGDLVELAREDRPSPAVEPVELAAVVGQAVTRVRRRAQGLDFDVRTEPWWLTGDAAGLERAVTNLLDNAAKWSPEGGVVRVHLSGGTLMVADAGPGLDPEDVPHVFDRFYRAATSRTMPGSGLGLAIVKAVADRHGGGVRAGEGPDGGAAFWLTLPGAPSPPDDTAG